MKYLLLLTGILVSDYLQAGPEIQITDTTVDRSLFDLSLEQLLNIRVVTAATGIEQRIKDAPAAITVIEASEWQAMGARTLFEAINTAAGVHIGKAQTALANNKPIIRGISGSFGQQVLVLIDGQPLRRIRDGGSFIGQHIPLAGFKRIEVISSPGSVVYGADAVGGIINLVSYAADELPSTITARTGAFDTRDLEAATSFKLGEHVFQIAVAKHQAESDPNNIIDHDLQSTLDDLFDTNASLAPGLFDEHYNINNLRGQWVWQWLETNAYFWDNRGSGTAAGISQALDPNGWARQQLQMYNTNVDFSAWIPGSLKLKYTFRRVLSETVFNVFPAGAVLPVDADNNINFANVDRLVEFPYGVMGTPGGDNRASSLQLEHILTLGAHQVRWELGTEHITVHSRESKNFGAGVLQDGETLAGEQLEPVTHTPFIYIPDKSRDIVYLSLQDQWRFHPSWVATLGVRLDDYNDIGSSTNPRVGLTWEVSEHLILKTFTGSAFRAPTFVDLYSQNNPATVGNPDLEPETIDTYESGLTGTFLASAKLQVDLSAYKYTNDNIIRYEPQGGVQLASNGGYQTGEGFEAQFNWRLNAITTLKGNYSYLNSDTDEGTDISAVPGQMANLSIFIRPSIFNWYFGTKWVADRVRSIDDNRTAIDDYFWVNTRLETRWQQFTFGITINNLFDTDAREPSNGFVLNDYPLPGRQWMLDIGLNNF